MQEESVQPQKDQASESALDEQLAEARAKLAEQREQMLRAVADADNARKRAQTEAANAQKYALERFANGLLPVLDSLEAALKGARELVGVHATLRQLSAALVRNKVLEINPAPASKFDPHQHQAISVVPAAQEPNTVVAVLQKGYLIADRVLRPALVTVSASA